MNRILLAIGVIGVMSAEVSAFPPYVNSRYGLPELPSSFSNYQCSDCHVHPSGGGACSPNGDPRIPCFNPFGIAYRTSGWSTALGNADADGDGIDNATELGQFGSAGFPASAESVGCDMLACATGGFAECNMFVDCTSALGTSPTQNYAFSFECAPGTEGITTGTAAWGCTDIDECATNTCPIGRCVERPLNNWQAPGFDCDTTECGVTDDCVTSAQCVEGTGTGDFVCVCAAGFEGDGKSTGTGCADIDECATQNDTCDVNATCTNSAGAFDCACNAGFAGDGQTCAPVVEMDAGMDMDTPDMDTSDMAPADVGMADLGSDVGEADTGATDLGGAVDMGTDTFVFTEVTPRQVGPTTNPTRSQSGSLTGDGCASASGGASWLLLLIGLGLLRRR